MCNLFDTNMFTNKNFMFTADAMVTGKGALSMNQRPKLIVDTDGAWSTK